MRTIFSPPGLVLHEFRPPAFEGSELRKSRLRLIAARGYFTLSGMCPSTYVLVVGLNLSHVALFLFVVSVVVGHSVLFLAATPGTPVLLTRCIFHGFYVLFRVDCPSHNVTGITGRGPDILHFWVGRILLWTVLIGFPLYQEDCIT